MKQVKELKSSVSKLESQNKKQELKAECLKRSLDVTINGFMGSMIKMMNLGKNRRPELKLSLG